MKWMAGLFIASAMALVTDTVAGQGSAAADRTEARVIFLTEYGFQPRQVNIKPGPLRLILRARIGGVDSWQITEAGKATAKASIAKRSKALARDIQTFTPGDYELTVPAYPQWKCLIRVQP